MILWEYSLDEIQLQHLFCTNRNFLNDLTKHFDLISIPIINVHSFPILCRWRRTYHATISFRKWHSWSSGAGSRLKRNICSGGNVVAKPTWPGQKRQFQRWTNVKITAIGSAIVTMLALCGTLYVLARPDRKHAFRAELLRECPATWLHFTLLPVAIVNSSLPSATGRSLSLRCASTPRPTDFAPRSYQSPLS